MSDIENKIPCKLDAATEQRMVPREQDCAPAGTVSEADERKELELKHGLREEDLP